MNIEEAKNQRSDISLEGRIEEKGEARTVNTKYGETQVCDSYIADETGRIKLTLWGEDIEKVNNGDTVSIQGAYTTTFRNEVQLNVPKKNGKLALVTSFIDSEAMLLITIKINDKKTLSLIRYWLSDPCIIFSPIKSIGILK